MAIGIMQGAAGMNYDINRDMYYDDARRCEYERAMQYRRQEEEEYRRMQNAAYYNPAQQQGKLVNPTPMPDTKDPLAFLQKTDNKLLLTGETQ
jgi:hypothetical protein